MRATSVFLLVLSSLLAGCADDCPGGSECAIGPSCYSSCEKLFGPESSGGCDIQVAGHEGESGRAEMINQCVAHCESAMNRAGEVGTYDPNAREGSDAIALENEQQAALWMDCIADTSCDLLDPYEGGYCAPVQNFP